MIAIKPISFVGLCFFAAFSPTATDCTLASVQLDSTLGRGAITQTIVYEYDEVVFEPPLSIGSPLPEKAHPALKATLETIAAMKAQDAEAWIDLLDPESRAHLAEEARATSIDGVRSPAMNRLVKNWESLSERGTEAYVIAMAHGPTFTAVQVEFRRPACEFPLGQKGMDPNWRDHRLRLRLNFAPPRSNSGSAKPDAESPSWVHTFAYMSHPMTLQWWTEQSTIERSASALEWSAWTFPMKPQPKPAFKEAPE